MNYKCRKVATAKMLPVVLVATIAQPGFDCSKVDFTPVWVCSDSSHYSATSDCNADWGTSGFFSGTVRDSGSGFNYCSASCPSASDKGACYTLVSAFAERMQTDGKFVTAWVYEDDDNKGQFQLAISRSASCSSSVQYGGNELSAACEIGYRSHHVTFNPDRISTRARRQAATGATQVTNTLFVEEVEDSDDGLTEGELAAVIVGSVCMVIFLAGTLLLSKKKPEDSTISNDVFF